MSSPENSVSYSRVAKLTHGRHCHCSSCAAQNWAETRLAPCGMHGESCPRAYDPIDASLGSIIRQDGSIVDREALAAKVVAATLMGEGWTCEMHEPDADCPVCRDLYAGTAKALIEGLAHPEKYLSAEEIAEYERCKQSIYESAVWFR